MQLHLIETGYFKLDGGAMFGVVPKSIWQKTNPADQNNLCTWAMRCLLVEDGNQLVLIDNGIGSKQPQSFLKHYHIHGTTLHQSLKNLTIEPSQITHNVLTHLHFDHCGGGLVKKGNSEEIIPFFPEAQYWSHTGHWQWAAQPNVREKASFLPENILPLEPTGQLRFIDQSKFPLLSISFHTVDGHTEKQLIPHINYKGKTIVFVADLLPSVGHIPLPYIMGYDTRPLLSMDEKSKFLNNAADLDYILFFEHDPIHECCTVQHTEKGVRVKETFRLKDI